MGWSKCTKCDSHLFEVVEQSNVRNSRYKLWFVQCASCGTVVGVLNYLDAALYLGPKIEALENLEKRIENRIENIEFLLHQLLTKPQR